MQLARPVRWAVERMRGLSVAKRRYAIVGTGMSCLNIGMLMLLVDVLAIAPVVANISRTIGTTQIHFCAHRWYTWRKLDERASRPFWQQWRRFHVLRIGSTAIQQFTFFLLVNMGVYHLIAYFMCITAMTVVNFTQSEKFIFGSKGSDTITSL